MDHGAKKDISEPATTLVGMFKHGDWELSNLPMGFQGHMMNHVRIKELQIVVTKPYLQPNTFESFFDWATKDERVYINNALDKFIKEMKRLSFTSLLKETDEKILS